MNKLKKSHIRSGNAGKKAYRHSFSAGKERVGNEQAARGRDITEKPAKRIAKKAGTTTNDLLQLTMQLKAILNATPDNVSLLTPDMRIVWANKTVTDKLGKSLKEITGQYCYTMWRGRSTYCEGCPAINGFTSGKVAISEIAAIDNKILEMRLVPLLDDKGTMTGIVDLGRDVTERRKASQEKERLQAELFQSQKMEAIGLLAGGIAHDLNNILTVIQGHLDLSLMKMDTGNTLRSELEEIRSTTSRGADLTKQLLMFSRKQPLNITPVNLNDLIDGFRKMLMRLIGEHITIITEIEPDVWTIKADTGSIEQLIMNMVVNARDAMTNGGTIHIKTGNTSISDRDKTGMSDARPGNFVCLSISDTGKGMDDATLQHLFEPFFTTKEKGSGLGLSVAYGIVKQHKGWINVQSNQGQGTTFRIYLPQG